NGDGQPDILFQNSTSGNLYVWYLHGTTMFAGGFLNPANPGSGWNAVGTADLNGDGQPEDRKSTRLNSSHLVISYAVFCLTKKNAPGDHLRGERNIKMRSRGYVHQSPVVGDHLYRKRDALAPLCRTRFRGSQRGLRRRCLC